MSIVKRGNIYWAIFTAPNGQRIRKSTGTADKKLAQEFHDDLKNEMWRIVKLGEKPKYLWQDAAKRWIKEMNHKRTMREDKRFLRWFHDHLYDKRLVDIDKELINQLIEIRQSEGALNAKAGKPIGVPLNDDAMSVLQKQIGKHDTFVFTFEGNTVKEPNSTAWEKALKRAGIENFKWHDLRHTWATRHAVEGTPLQALKKLGGWASWKSMERYIHLCVKDVEEYTENVKVV